MTPSEHDRQRGRTATVAEYGTRFEADVASALLTDQGIPSMVRADPAHAVAPHLVTDRLFRVEVLVDDLDAARGALGLDVPRDVEAEQLDAQFFRIPFEHRPRWVRWLTVLVIVAIAGPIVLTAAVLLVSILSAAAPG